MIDRILLRKYSGESLLLLISICVTLFAFSWVRVWVVSLLDIGQFGAIMEQLKVFERFAPIDFDSIVTYPGRVGMTYDEPIVILCTVIWSVARGSDVVSGELGRGTMEFVLAQPVERGTLLCSHAIVAVTGLAIICMAVWLGTAAGIQFTTVYESVAPPSLKIPIINIDLPLTMDEPIKQAIPLRDRVDPMTYASSTFHLFSLGFFLLGLSTMVSAIDRYRWRTIGLVVAVYVIQLVVFGLGKAAASLDWLLSFSFFSCYRPQMMTSLYVDQGRWAPWSMTREVQGMVLSPLVYPLILIGLGLACYAVAAIRFNRRDLPAPL